LWNRSITKLEKCWCILIIKIVRTRLIEVEAENGVIVGSLIGTGISKGPHKFSLEYPEITGKVICIARCACGYQVEILQFEGWGGTRELQKRWEEHTGDF